MVVIVMQRVVTKQVHIFVNVRMASLRMVSVVYVNKVSLDVTSYPISFVRVLKVSS